MDAVSGSTAVPAAAPPARTDALRQILLGTVVGSAALWLTFRGVDWAEFSAVLADVDPTLTLAALAANLAALLVMIVRWQVFLSAIAAALTHRLATGGARYRHPNRVERPIPVDTVPFGSFKKSLWLLVGGYDERRTVNEDFVLNYRARRAGRLVLLDPSIRSTYFARETFGALARQYFRYGWVKASMLKQYPGAIRWRQVVPGAFTAALIILGMISTVVPAARWLLGALLVTYAGALLAAAVQLSLRTRDWSHIPLYALTFAIVQLAWGFGAAVNNITFGRWPVWTRP